MTSEIWKPVAAYEDKYEVSNLGNVRNAKTKRMLKPMLTGAPPRKYATVRLSTTPRADYKVHTLVLTMFVGPAPEGMIGCHKDDDQTNNALSNLEWGTRQHNAVTCAKLGNRADQKLTAGEMQDIIDLRKLGVSGRELAKVYGVSEQRICDITKGRACVTK